MIYQKCCSSPSKSSSRLMAFIQVDGLCFLSGQRSNEPHEDFRSVIGSQTAKIKLAFFRRLATKMEKHGNKT